MQLTNWFLDSVANCHRTADISDLILGSLAKTDKYIEVADNNFVTKKQTEEFQIKYVTIMENPSLPRYITYYCHQTWKIDYFPLLC